MVLSLMKVQTLAFSLPISNSGHDSYEFAKDKPLKLLNGGHLLAILNKNGRKGYINIQEAKEQSLL